MRVRYQSVTYTFGGAASSVEQHFRELRDAMLHNGQQYAYLQPAAPWRPPMDIHETPEAIIVKIEVAGLRDDQIEVVLYDNALVVTGQREDDGEHDDTLCYHEAQVRYGPFRADVMLPALVDREGAEAAYEHGFLRIRLPKMAARVHTAPEAGMPRSERTAADGKLAHAARLDAASSGVAML